MSRHGDREGGFAMMVVLMAVAALVLIVTLAIHVAQTDYSDAQSLRHEDTLSVAAEAMLERYAAKMTLDPLFYRHYVDEAEPPRHCTDPTSAGYNGVVQPGNAWYTDCGTWDYEPASGFFYHPSLEGGAGDADDVGALIGISPPVNGGSLTVTVVTTQEAFHRTRAVVSEIHSEAISEFAFLQDEDLRFGSGAVFTGKIYTAGDLDFTQDSPRAVVHKNIFAEGAIGRTAGYGPPTFADGAQGYDTTGHYLNIRTVYPEPLDFDRFWDDLDAIRQVACNGQGLCLSRSLNPGLGLTQNPTAWLIQPIVEAGKGRVKIWASFQNSSTSCLTTEEWWWVNSQNASWTLLGTFDIPATGVLWADNHLVIGTPSLPVTVNGALTAYAGTMASPKNVIIGSDIRYANGLTGTDVFGIIASDEIYINPSSVGSDNVLNIDAALLSQGGILGVGRSCGTDGNVLLPLSWGDPVATLNSNGAIAKVRTGELSAHFGTRNYSFDSRLESLRPPFYPLLRDSWSFAAWREIAVPCWAEGACP
jgi:hypothetical protein